MRMLWEAEFKVRQAVQSRMAARPRRFGGTHSSERGVSQTKAAGSFESVVTLSGCGAQWYLKRCAFQTFLWSGRAEGFSASVQPHRAPISIRNAGVCLAASPNCLDSLEPVIFAPHGDGATNATVNSTLQRRL
eukprot:6236073-Amphidinium_carterae.1